MAKQEQQGSICVTQEGASVRVTAPAEWLQDMNSWGRFTNPAGEALLSNSGWAYLLCWRESAPEHHVSELARVTLADSDPRERILVLDCADPAAAAELAAHLTARLASAEPASYEPRYWNNRGRLQADYNRLYRKLVPASGKAATTDGEILRCMSKVYYDRYNNGSGNKLAYHFMYLASCQLDIPELATLKVEKKMSDQAWDAAVDQVVAYLLEQERRAADPAENAATAATTVRVLMSQADACNMDIWPRFTAPWLAGAPSAELMQMSAWEFVLCWGEVKAEVKPAADAQGLPAGLASAAAGRVRLQRNMAVGLEAARVDKLGPNAWVIIFDCSDAATAATLAEHLSGQGFTVNNSAAEAAALAS